MPRAADAASSCRRPPGPRRSLRPDTGPPAGRGPRSLRYGPRAGKTCPGRRRSDGTVAGSIATWMVLARSRAEMPVVTPNFLAASTLTVNAVSRESVLSGVICCRPSARVRSGVSARQTNPRPCLTMKLIMSGVTSWAPPTRSPSLSRASSSATTITRPAWMSATACSMVPKGILLSYPLPLYHLAHELADHISLEVDPIPRLERPQRGLLQREGDQRHLNPAGRRHGVHREAHPVHRDRPVQERHAHQIRRHIDIHQQGVFRLPGGDHGPQAVHVALGGLPAPPGGSPPSRVRPRVVVTTSTAKQPSPASTTVRQAPLTAMLSPAARS